MNIAYQAFGDGPFDLVFVPGFISHIELAWEESYLARFLRRLAAFTRVIFFDKRGTGLSDPVSQPPGLAERMDDIRAVMDAAGSRRAALFGVSDGGCLCIAFAVAHPERSASLVTYGSFARRLRTAGYPWGWSAEHLAEVLRGMDQGWASGKWWAAANPSVAGDERYQEWWARYLRAAASPAMGRGALGLNAELDIRHLLAQVAVPTLVIHRTNEQWVDAGPAYWAAGPATRRQPPRGVVPAQLQLAVAVRGPHHRDLALDAVQADGAVRPQALDLPLAFQLHAELGEERDGGVQVVDDDPDVVHPLNGHVRQHTDAASRQPGAEGTGGSVGLTVTPIDSVTLSDAYDAGERAPARRSGRR